MKILHIDSGLFADASVSRQLSKAIVEQLTAKHDDVIVEYLDLVKDEIPHLTAQILTGQQSEQTQLTDQIINQYLDADVIVVGAGMYNFGLSSHLKAWIDRICAAGRTFKYTETGPVGLAGNKTVYIASARGGVYGENNPLDSQESLLKTVFNFTGISDVHIIRAEGVNMGEEAKKAALDQAMQQIKAI